LSPGPRRYSSAGIADVFLSSLADFSSLPAADPEACAGCARFAVSASAAATAKQREAGVWIMAGPPFCSVRGGNPVAAAPGHDGSRERLARERAGVNGVRGITGRADLDAESGREAVVLDPSDQAIDDLQRILVAGVEQRQRERALVRAPEV